MQLTENEVADLLLVSGLDFAPLTAEQRMQASMEARTRRRGAAFDDAGSLAFRRQVDAVGAVLRPETRVLLANTPLLWVESYLTQARAFDWQGRSAMMVCEGLFHLVHFRSALSQVCNLLKRFDPPVDGHDPDMLPRSELMMLAGHAILADAYVNQRPPATIADLLGQSASRNLDLGVSTSMLLLVLHELGHVALGHARAVPLSTDLAAQAVPDPGDLEGRRRVELEADAFAIDALEDEWRPQVLASVISLYDAFHFFELFGVREAGEYPSAEERLTTMVHRMGLAPKDLTFAVSWIADYRNRATAVAASNVTPGEMVDRFDRTMDIRTAYHCVSRIRGELEAAGLVLDLPEEV